jgi:uncharacterized OB-fold protein
VGDVFRVLPRVTAGDRHFWTGGADGELRILRCQDCGFWIHPPKPRCPECLSSAVSPETTGGRGTVYTFTLNHQPWNPTYEHPYVIAVVELDEQPNLRVTTNIHDCDPQDVHIGMPVEVTFLEVEDVWLPMFRPAETP